MSLPPGPTLPSVLQVLRWIRTPYEMLEDYAARFGDIFTITIPALGPIVILADPEAIKEVFAFGPDDGHAGPANAVLRPFLGSKSLLLLDGADHLRHRKIMMPAFHGERMQAYGQTMLDLSDEAIDQMPVGTPFPIHDVFQKITLGIIVRTIFGVTDPALFAEISRLVGESLDLVAWPGFLFPQMQVDLGPKSPWGRFQRLGARARELLLAEVARARREGTAGRSDVLAMLVAARDERGRALSDDELHDELVTLLIAGHETTATALTWAVRHLLANPEVLVRLRGEVATAPGPSGLSPEKLARLELLDGCVKEALRVQPVLPLVGRVLQRPMRFLGYDLPAGTRLAPSIYLVHHRRSLYPEPNRFNPDRYRTFKPGPSEWMPFGGGIRRCVGAAFAVYEMKMVLAKVATRVELQLAQQRRVAAVRRSITMTPEGGLPVLATAVSPRAPASAAAELPLPTGRASEPSRPR